MHPAIFQTFEAIVTKEFKGGAVLEVGAVPSSDSLLSMSCLKGAKRVGINLVDTGIYSDFEVIKGNANDMNMFKDSSFSLVMSNATLEHDKFFWKSLEEMKRVTCRGGLIIIGVPGFVKYKINSWQPTFMPNALKHSTSTMGDYYRFSEECVMEVFLDGLKERKITHLLLPPRIIGSGIR